jgi:divalent metal cation (Fe/Co/Zn/Cd) transporter
MNPSIHLKQYAARIAGTFAQWWKLAGAMVLIAAVLAVALLELLGPTPVMLWLARAKRQAAHALHSRALEADSVQTTACCWLSPIVLDGVGLNALLGWWWADPVAALGMTYFLVAEGREAWRGDECCGDFL